MKTLSSIIIAFIIINFYGCCDQKQKKVAFDEDLIQFISENPIYSRNSEMLPSYEFSVFFVQGEGGQIIELHPRELEEIHNEDYSSWNYKKFVRKALNQELTIKTNKGRVVMLDKNVMDNYISNTLPDFMNLYCDISSTGKYSTKIDIPEDQDYISSVLYYAFINNYLAFYDDFLGIFWIVKTSECMD